MSHESNDKQGEEQGGVIAVPAPAPTPALSPAEMRDLYREAINFLDYNYARFLTHILNIGYPQATTMLPTAAVAVHKKDGEGDDDVMSQERVKDFRFYFNPSFMQMLNEGQTKGSEAVAFVLAHETMHILLNHIWLGQRFKNKARFNVAADAVINDYLVSMGFEMPIFKGDKETALVKGEQVVGFNCANSTVGEVYARMPDDICGGPNEDGSGQGDGDEGDDGGYGNFGGQRADDHGWIHNPDKATEKKVKQAAGSPTVPQDVQDKAQDSQRQAQYKMHGSGVGSAQAYSELQGVSLKWAKLLQKIHPDVFKGGPKPAPSWHRRPRKLYGVPSVYLPVEKPGKDNLRGEMPSIVMALDTSGSIGEEEANQFVNMAKSVPQRKIKLFVCTFQTQYEELDLNNPEWHSGGTDFSAISGYIEDKVRPKLRGRYPKGIVVLTDGYANFSRGNPSAEESKSWFWLITDGGSAGYGGGLPGQIESLSDYTA